MKRTLILSLVLMTLTSLLSGCIIYPGWYDDDGYYGGHHHRHGDYEERGYERGRGR